MDALDELRKYRYRLPRSQRRLRPRSDHMADAMQYAIAGFLKTPSWEEAFFERWFWRGAAIAGLYWAFAFAASFF
jgi:hypothetical protein